VAARGAGRVAVDAARRALAEEIHRAGEAHDAGLADRRLRMRNLEPETAELLGLLVVGTAARRVLEIGTSNGYSTIWLADAVEVRGGTVVSVELDPARTDAAAGNLARAGLCGVVELRTEDAAGVLADSADGVWDLVFLDAERDAYPSYLPDIVRVLRPGGMLAVDNVVSHAHELVCFTALVEAEPRLRTTVVPVGAGLRLAVRLG